MDNVFGECHTPYTLKTSFVDLEKEQVHCICYKRLNLSSLPNSPYCFSDNQMLLTQLTHPFPHFYIVLIYIIKLLLVLNIAVILLAGCFTIPNQSKSINFLNTKWKYFTGFYLQGTAMFEIKLYLNLHHCMQAVPNFTKCHQRLLSMQCN